MGTTCFTSVENMIPICLYPEYRQEKNDRLSIELPSKII